MGTNPGWRETVRRVRAERSMWRVCRTTLSALGVDAAPGSDGAGEDARFCEMAACLRFRLEVVALLAGAVDITTAGGEGSRGELGASIAVVAAADVYSTTS